jgi:hypothetical protein
MKKSRKTGGTGMSKTYSGWKVLLWLIAVYHVVSGLLLFFSGELAIRALNSLAGIRITGSPELGIAGEILGCYLLAFGLMMGVAAWNPVKNRAIITVGLVLFALRLFQRLIFAEKVMQVMQIPSAKYWSAAAIVAVLALLMGIFRWQLYRDMHGIDQ